MRVSFSLILLQAFVIWSVKGQQQCGDSRISQHACELKGCVWNAEAAPRCTHRQTGNYWAEPDATAEPTTYRRMGHLYTASVQEFRRPTIVDVEVAEAASLDAFGRLAEEGAAGDSVFAEGKLPKPNFYESTEEHPDNEEGSVAATDSMTAEEAAEPSYPPEEHEESPLSELEETGTEAEQSHVEQEEEPEGVAQESKSGADITFSKEKDHKISKIGLAKFFEESKHIQARETRESSSEKDPVSSSPIVGTRVDSSTAVAAEDLGENDGDKYNPCRVGKKEGVNGESQLMSGGHVMCNTSVPVDDDTVELEKIASHSSTDEIPPVETSVKQIDALSDGNFVTETIEQQQSMFDNLKTEGIFKSKDSLSIDKITETTTFDEGSGIGTIEAKHEETMVGKLPVEELATIEPKKIVDPTAISSEGIATVQRVAKPLEYLETPTVGTSQQTIEMIAMPETPYLTEVVTLRAPELDAPAEAAWRQKLIDDIGNDELPGTFYEGYGVTTGSSYKQYDELKKAAAITQQTRSHLFRAVQDSQPLKETYEFLDIDSWKVPTEKIMKELTLHERYEDYSGSGWSAHGKSYGDASVARPLEVEYADMESGHVSHLEHAAESKIKSLVEKYSTDSHSYPSKICTSYRHTPCGHNGVTAEECSSLGCCWITSSGIEKTNGCFKSDSVLPLAL